ncbi:MAG: hypothetical protein IPM59_02570 [Chloracidobacterium sp.]|nr:hypothetical protein [Chloracidobacterium sp.]
MNDPPQATSPGPTAFGWRHAVIAAIVFGSLATLLIIWPPFGQYQEYHNFADKRPLIGIPNFGDVASNLGFLLVGIAGLITLFKRHAGPMQAAWIVMFSGIASVGVASAYYHWAPADATLVWDRLTLTVGFMGMFVALLGEYISPRLRVLLVPAIVIGAGSVFYWDQFQDLRFYYWVQMMPLLVVPVLLLLFRPMYSHGWLIFAGAIWYGLAKLAELWDSVIFNAVGGVISGHTIKHLLAAIGCLSILMALRLRKTANG